MMMIVDDVVVEDRKRSLAEADGPCHGRVQAPVSEATTRNAAALRVRIGGCQLRSWRPPSRAGQNAIRIDSNSRLYGFLFDRFVYGGIVLTFLYQY